MTQKLPYQGSLWAWRGYLHFSDFLLPPSNFRVFYLRSSRSIRFNFLTLSLLIKPPVIDLLCILNFFKQLQIPDFFLTKFNLEYRHILTLILPEYFLLILLLNIQSHCVHEQLFHCVNFNFLNKFTNYYYFIWDLQFLRRSEMRYYEIFIPPIFIH